jgi:hypothetical protein
MTPEEIAGAIDFAYESLKEGAASWRDREPSGHEEAALWQSVVASDCMYGRPILASGQIRIVLQLKPEPDGPPDSFKFYDDEKSERLIDKARNGDSVATSVLCNNAARFVESGRPLPTRLRELIVEVLKAVADARPTKRGRDPYANHPRNFQIACTIFNVINLGFRPTKNRATEAESACSIVAKALAKLDIHLSDVSIEKIWERFSRDFSDPS